MRKTTKRPAPASRHALEVGDVPVDGVQALRGGVHADTASDRMARGPDGSTGDMRP